MTLAKRRADRFAKLWGHENDFECHGNVFWDNRGDRWCIGDTEYISGGWADGEELFGWQVSFGEEDGRQVVEYEFTRSTAKYRNYNGVRHELAVKIIETVAKVCAELGDPMETRR